ncbi:6283_t:CDS:1, partial [Dentiscutata heterogama]
LVFLKRSKHLKMLKKSFILSLIFAIAIFNTLIPAESPDQGRRLISGTSSSSLKARQSCPANFFECPDGVGCCPLGSTCTTNYKCAIPCNSTTVVCDATTCCYKNTICCFGGGCCPVGSTCGSNFTCI